MLSPGSRLFVPSVDSQTSAVSLSTYARCLRAYVYQTQLMSMRLRIMAVERGQYLAPARAGRDRAGLPSNRAPAQWSQIMQQYMRDLIRG